MRIGVLFNCQAGGLAASLQALLPRAEIISYRLPQLGGRLQQQIEAADDLASCDLVISSPVDSGFPPLQRRVLESRCARFYAIPPFRFAGFHPDMTALIENNALVVGPTGPYLPRLAIACYVAGLPEDVCVDLYNRLIFSRLGYLHEFSVQSKLVRQLYAGYGIDVTPLLGEWLADGCFMHSYNHPHIRVLFSLAKALCAKLALPVENSDASAENIEDELALHASHAVFPEIAAAIGIAPAGCFRAGHLLDGGAPMTFETFISRSFTSFDAVAEAVLLRADRLEPALAAIGRKALPSRPPARLSPRSLLTWHGTVLRARSNGELYAQGLTDPAPGHDLVLQLPQVHRFPRQTLPELGGVQLQAAEHGLVRLSRNSHFLCAELERAEVLFNRLAAAAWESFMPVSAETLAALRLLLGHDWQDADGERWIRRGQIRLLPGFVLRLGGDHFDLRHPGAIEALAAGGGLRLRQRDRILELYPRQAPETAEDRAPEAGVLSLGGRVTVQGAPESLHPPLTGAFPDFAWVAEVTAPYLRQGEPAARRVSVVRGEALLLRQDQTMSARRPPPAGPSVPLLLASFGASELGEPTLEAALQLHMLAPFRVPEAELLLASAANIELPMLDLLGLGGATRAMPGTACLAPDVLRLDDPRLADLPALAVADFRARAVFHAGDHSGATPANILLTGAGQMPRATEAAVLAALAPFGFVGLDLASLPPRARVAVFSRARIVVGTSGAALANLLFCGPGAAVVELSPRDNFRPGWWIAAEKLGLRYGVIPCAAAADGLQVDPASVTALLNMLRSYV
jgi:hypothetical protein